MTTRREKLLRLCESANLGTLGAIRMRQLYTHLIDENEKLRGALEFYGDKANYWREKTQDGKSRSTGNWCFDILLNDFERNIDGPQGTQDYAGLRARQALTAGPLDALLEKEK